MKKIVKHINIALVLIFLCQLLPTKRDAESSLPLLIFVLILYGYYLMQLRFNKNKTRIRTTKDVITILYYILTLWELATSKLDIIDKVLYPTPSVIIKLLIQELPEFFKGFISSFQILLIGYIFALIIAVPLALLIGWKERLYNAISPYTKVLGPIPPIVYVPYIVAIMPTFRTASIFVIFVGVFWPVFTLTLHGIFNIDKKIIDSAKVLNVSEKTMLLEIIFPAILPSIIRGSSMGLSSSFGILTAAEMIGARSGLGFYVKYFSDFLDYPKVIVGIIYIGIAVTGATLLFKKVEDRLLRWRV